MERENCSICNCKFKLEDEIFCLNKVPIKLSCTENIIKKYSDLVFLQCKNCNTIQLKKLIPLDILYSESHNLTSEGKTWEKYFYLFNEKIKNIINDKNVLEIGCPSGKIANKLGNFKKWFIVEPNKNKNIVLNEKICFIEKFFDEKFYINEEIDVITHSHLFEHIYFPNDFLKKCNELLKEDGEMFFGIPNMEYFTENKNIPFLGICFEHTIFLNKENVTFLLKKNNFEILDIFYFENHSTLFHCKKKNLQKEFLNNNFIIKNYIKNFFDSENLLNLFVKKCNKLIENTNKEVFIFGASNITQFLLNMELNLNKIKGILDNCKEKQNKYFFSNELKIYEPASILKTKNCIILLKNGYYNDEIKEQILLINKNTEIII
jgi:SAM-dependent methyltransferase